MGAWRKTKGYDEPQSANVASGVPTTILSRTIPHSTALKLTHFGNNVQPVGGWGFTTWVVKINGVPVSPLGKVLDQLGTIGDPTRLGEEPIARGGDLLEVEVTQTTGAAANVAVRLKGEFGRER